MAATTEGRSHAERMDGIYGVQRHVYDLTRKYYLFGRDRLVRELKPKPGQRVLEIGCGTARNLVLITRRYPGARCYGLDISVEMLKSARAKLDREALGAQIHLACGDATRFDPARLYRQPDFDRIVFAYTLSMIPDWQAALRLAAGSLAERGEIHIVDFGMQQGLPRWFARLLEAWLAKFHVERRAGLAAFCEELAGEQHLELEMHRRYGDYARSLVLRRV